MLPGREGCFSAISRSLDLGCSALTEASTAIVESGEVGERVVAIVFEHAMDDVGTTSLQELHVANASCYNGVRLYNVKRNC